MELNQCNCDDSFEAKVLLREEREWVIRRHPYLVLLVIASLLEHELLVKK